MVMPGPHLGRHAEPPLKDHRGCRGLLGRKNHPERDVNELVALAIRGRIASEVNQDQLEHLRIRVGIRARTRA